MEEVQFVYKAQPFLSENFEKRIVQACLRGLTISGHKMIGDLQGISLCGTTWVSCSSKRPQKLHYKIDLLYLFPHEIAQGTEGLKH